MRLILTLCAMAICAGCAAPPPAPLPDAGVPESLARERASRISGLRYDVTLTIPNARATPVTGRVAVSFDLRDRSTPLALDFEPDAKGRIDSVSAGGTSVEPHVENGHLMLPASALREGRNEIVVQFSAGDAPLNRSDDFLYTIFVPARAHEAFPCFDQPDLKARWTLALDVPAAWTTIANGAETARSTADGRTRVSFAETQPIASYLFAFAAGRFSVEEAERNGRTMRMVHRETDAAKVAANRDAIFDLHAGALAWMEQYTGIPYPFGKFDIFVVPAFQFGGMEHPGAIFYNAGGLMLDASATQNQQLERASTIAHETAHMWFGDLVTMRWFTDVWMKEVFANFMAAKIVNPAFPEVNHQLRFLHAYYPAAYDVDRTAGSNAIRQPLDNLKDAGVLYGAIIYQKAPIVMRQLETMVGADAFRDGLRQYLQTFAYGNATWPDLIAILDGRTPEDLAAWSRAWVEEAGRPTVTAELTVRDGVVESLAYAQSDPVAPRGLTWTQDIQVALGYPGAGRTRLLPVRLSGSRTEVVEARGLPAPLFALTNGGGIAYGELHLDRGSLAWLTAHLPEIDDPLTRGAAWVTLWDATLDGDVPAATFVDLAVKALPLERDELNIQRILSMLNRAFWIFLTPEERTSRAARLEAAISNGLASARTMSVKGAYFAALRNVATTPPTLARLARIWRGTEEVRGLTLAENDFIALAQQLAVREVTGWDEILTQQIERTQNPDRKARLQFVAPALSADPSQRARFFASLADVENRRHEAWVLDAVDYLHHPLRADASIGFIGPSLDLLREIQQTGDIFFPKRWMDATLGGHRSREAAQIVRTYLDALPPEYPDRLRRTILSAADDLFRAAR